MKMLHPQRRKGEVISYDASRPEVLIADAIVNRFMSMLRLWKPALRTL
jgi:hypothetical protein